MLGINILVKWINKNVVNVFSGRCLKSRYKHSICQSCISHCPQKAISFDEVIKINNSTCNGCGICVNLCPTGAFQLSDLSYIRLFNKIDNRGSIVFSCEKSSLNHGVKVPCLGYLNLSFLISIAIARKKPIIINVSECNSCENHIGLKITRETTAKLKKINEILNLDVDIKVSENYLEEADDINYSRREFFSVFRNKATDKVSDILNVINEEIPEDSLKEQKNPEHRKLLLHFWPEIVNQTQIEHTCIPFTEIKVESKCNLCFVCEKTCPTGAILRCENDSKLTLKHNIDYCVGCGLCAEICPNGAIKYLESIDMSNLNKKKQIKLIEFSKANCIECGKDFISLNDGLTCDTCSAKKQLAEDFFKGFN